jgi:hypothetical protein
MASPRPAVPWLVRRLLPADAVGTYVLWDGHAPFYTGRSNTSLRRRQTEHSRVFMDAHFTSDIAHLFGIAFDTECSLFHALVGGAINQIHLGCPENSTACPFCRDSFHLARVTPPGSALVDQQVTTKPSAGMHDGTPGRPREGTDHDHHSHVQRSRRS